MGDERCSPKARQLIEDFANEEWVSPASHWELAIKISLDEKGVATMTPIRAVIRDRRIEIPAPDDLPDGTEIVVELTPVWRETGLTKDAWDDTPEGIEAWIEAVRNLEPLVFTD